MESYQQEQNSEQTVKELCNSRGRNMKIINKTNNKKTTKEYSVIGKTITESK